MREVVGSAAKAAPEQIGVTAAKVGVIGALTVIVTVAVPVQPVTGAVPVTVYVVVAAGVTDTGVPGKLPGFHANVDPGILLVALNDDVLPTQIAAGVAVGVRIGLGLTTTVRVAVVAHTPIAGVKV